VGTSYRSQAARLSVGQVPVSRKACPDVALVVQPPGLLSSSRFFALRAKNDFLKPSSVARTWLRQKNTQQRIDEINEKPKGIDYR
jgi:hypothetical protein